MKYLTDLTSLLKRIKFCIILLGLALVSSVHAKKYSPILIEDSEIEFIKGLEVDKNWQKCDSKNLSRAAQYICYKHLAYALKDESPCKVFEGKKNYARCIGYVALSTKDETLCSKFNKEPFKRVCKKPSLYLILDSMDPNTRKRMERENLLPKKSDKKMKTSGK